MAGTKGEPAIKCVVARQSTAPTAAGATKRQAKPSGSLRALLGGGLILRPLGPLFFSPEAAVASHDGASTVDGDGAPTARTPASNGSTRPLPDYKQAAKRARANAGTARAAAPARDSAPMIAEAIAAAARAVAEAKRPADASAEKVVAKPLANVDRGSQPTLPASAAHEGHPVGANELISPLGRAHSDLRTAHGLGNGIASTPPLVGNAVPAMDLGAWVHWMKSGAQANQYYQQQLTRAQQPPPQQAWRPMWASRPPAPAAPAPAHVHAPVPAPVPLPAGPAHTQLAANQYPQPPGYAMYPGGNMGGNPSAVGGGYRPPWPPWPAPQQQVHPQQLHQHQQHQQAAPRLFPPPRPPPGSRARHRHA